MNNILITHLSIKIWQIFSKYDIIHIDNLVKNKHIS